MLHRFGTSALHVLILDPSTYKAEGQYLTGELCGTSVCVLLCENLPEELLFRFVFDSAFGAMCSTVFNT